MGFVMKKLCLLLITPLLFSLTGCPDITKPPVKSGENTANEQSVAKAEIVSGKVLDSQGKPISIKDSQITVIIRGTSIQGGRQVLKPEVNSNGEFEMKVPDGVYAVEGTIALLYEGKKYSIPLESSVNNEKPSDVGIVANLVMKISGAKKDDLGKYYGGQISLSYYGSTDISGKEPDSSKIKITATPVSLIDGNAGKELTFEKTMGELKSDGKLNDLPIGKYKLKAKLTNSAGKEFILKFSKSSAYIEEYEFTFRPGLTSLDAADSEIISLYYPVE